MQIETLILGAGAAGMMAAAHAGPGVLVVDHAKAPGEKIRISGGGRCNFTNMYCEPARFLGNNPHFHKSALARYTQWDFLDLVQSHNIAWHEKTLGQLFCDGKATQIVAMLLNEMDKAGAQLWLKSEVTGCTFEKGQFKTGIKKDGKAIEVISKNIILATGGKSIPKMGATGLSYDLAQQFGHSLTDTRPALVPFTFEKGRFEELSGVSLNTLAKNDKASFEEGMLFTHRGLSGPAILQISSYWREGESVALDLLPGTDLIDILQAQRSSGGRKNLTTEMATLLPGRLVNFLGQHYDLKGNIADLSNSRIEGLSDMLHSWQLTPTGSEGYRTAEVTLGGIDTDGIDSRTMMSKHQPGLYAIGEAVDVTGWLGGYNFQWAWSSGVAAGRAIAGHSS
ncbi:BaiN/RdsA family NAD(P)/FAD-dependent oxidoreductase [Thalassococcus lentus]|uniref:NAD(P)/FAD-dependent oxidoreductase n=1 Tax=Thalassococcus lentus TaxID=1210524 RepID=A0ABT4XTJ1_9RHOB|nr:NAD(P)/FAD-dependent oxidoreductase [Thalassococcus lentus]MDA7425261.1 NAD(P)/FAD-dependent oxidoreductase [Thalassococcus lentus]